MAGMFKVLMLSRIMTTTIAVLGDHFFADHVSQDAFKNNLAKRYMQKFNFSPLDDLVHQLAKPLSSWDAQYFLEIGHSNGYNHEKMLAFFPMFPRLMHFFALFIHSTSKDFNISLNFHSCLLLSAYLINLAAFILGGFALHKLTKLFFNSHRMAKRVVLLYAYNPASIFFTAFYSESLFFCFTALALYFLYRFNSLTLAVFFFALSSYTRSNGIVSVGFVIFYAMISHALAKPGVGGNFTQRVFDFVFDYVNFTVFQVKSTFALVSVLGTFYAFQYEAYRLFCHENNVNNDNPAWCSYYLGLSYTYVQDKYWENGFLRYWQFKKIPLFLLAAPVLATHIVAAGYFFVHLIFAYLEKQSMFELYPRFINPRFVARKWHQPGIFNQLALLPFVVHGLFLSFACIFFMHVEVATRFLFSSTVWTYWAIAGLVEFQCLGPKWTHVVFYTYYFVYFFGGIIAFGNFYPFT